jgi:hypothetical protein
MAIQTSVQSIEGPSSISLHLNGGTDPILTTRACNVHLIAPENSLYNYLVQDSVELALRTTKYTLNAYLHLKSKDK